MSINRFGKLQIISDYILLPLYVRVIVGDLLTRIAAEDQARRRAEAHAS